MTRSRSWGRRSNGAGRAARLAGVLLLAASGVAASPNPLLAPAAPPGEWWNTSYQYRQQITVTAGSAAVPAGYSVSIALNHQSLVSGGKSLANGDDVRIGYWNGSAWVELDRIIDPESSWNTTTTKIWFKLQAGIAALGTDDNYYVYYANSGATNPPVAGSGVFLFYDGLESGDLSVWDGSNTATGDVIGASTEQAYGGTWSLKAEVDNVTDAQAMVWADFATGQTRAYARVKIYLPPTFLTSDRVTVMQFLTGWSNVLSLTINNDMTLYMWNAVAAEAYGYLTTTPITTGVWHTLEMETVISPTAGEARFWLDGNLEASATGVNTGSSLLDRFSTGIYWTAPRTEPNYLYMDDIYGRITVSAAPAVALGIEEMYEPAVTSAVAEISPNDVFTSSTGNAFTYDILATISGVATGVDRIAVTVPSTFGNPTVTDVKVAGSSVAYTDNTAGKIISVDLAAKVTTTGNIQILFTADAPIAPDGTGQPFTSTVDDTSTVTFPQSTTEGDGDGDPADNNSWTVTTTDPPWSLLVRYWIDEAPSGQGIASLLDSEPSPLNMPLGYVGASPVWAGGSGGNRHLRFSGTSGTDTGGGLVDIGGTKVDAIHGSTTVTIEAKYMMDAGTACNGGDERIFGISENRGSIYGQLQVRSIIGDHTLAVMWSGDASVSRYALNGGCTLNSASVVHWVIDTTEPTASDRVRAYINGVRQTVTVQTGSWPAQSATIDLGAVGTRKMYIGQPYSGIATFNGRIWYVALYTGEMTDAQIVSNASALNSSDDGNTYAVSVTPDGLGFPVMRGAGTGYSYDFTLTNNSNVLEDFDLLARAGPAPSFITVDSITWAPTNKAAQPDSGRIAGVAASGSETITVWYSVAASTDGRVDTLYLRARSVSDTATDDEGRIEIEFATGAGNVLLIVSDQVSPNASDLALQAYLEANGLTVFFADDDSSTASWQSTISANNIIASYISHTSFSSKIGSKARDLTIGVVLANNGNWDGMAYATGNNQDIGTDTDIIDNSHYITSPFLTGILTIYSPAASRIAGFNLAAGAQILAQYPGDPTYSALVAFNTGAELKGGLTAAARRVGIYTNDNFVNWTADTKTLVLRSILWAGGTGAGGGPSYAVTVTPKGLGSPVVRQAGTGFSQDFTISNDGSTQEDFDLLAWTAPASSFLTIDSITFNGLSFITPPDSARLASLAASTSDTITLWYTVGSSSNGRVDTLFLAARSVANPAVADTGWAEVQFQAPAATLLGRYWIDEAPSGQQPTILIDDQASPVNLPITYSAGVDWTLRSGNRGLRSGDTLQTGMAIDTVAGTKYQTALDGATRATFVTVASFRNAKVTDSRVAGFDVQPSNSGAMIGLHNTGRLRFRYTSKIQGGTARVEWPPDYRDDTRRVFHIVYDSNEPADSNRIRLYVDGVRQTGVSLVSLGWPALGEGLDFSAADLRLSILNRNDGLRALDGDVHYYAVYDGALGDAQISSNAAALLASDDNNSYAVTVIPDGATVVRQAGGYSFDFNLNNGSTAIEDFDLLASVGPASSFITADSITGGGVSASATPDSTRITGVAAAADSAITVWYTVAASIDGRIDTLYLTGRSISDNSRTDLGWLEIEFEAVTVTVAPDGIDTLQLLPTAATGPTSYKFTITNTSTVVEPFDLLAFPGDVSTILTVDSINGPNVSGGVPGDSARTGGIAPAASDSAFVFFSLANGTAATLDSLYLKGRSVNQPTASDSGWVFVLLLKPNITITRSIAPAGNQSPGTDMTYTITITNDGNYSASSVVTVDSLATEVEFKVGSVVNTLPGGVGVTVEYSDDNGATWTYTPVSAGCAAPAGYDGCVTRIRWSLTNDLSYVAPNNTGDLEYVARIK